MQDLGQNSLKNQWYSLFDYITSQKETLSNIDCFSICQTPCCPIKDKTEPRVGRFVVFLPFELEYIATHMKFDYTILSFNWHNIETQTVEAISIPWGRHCPFVHGNKCRIYPLRPLDCKSFPLLSYSVGNPPQLEFLVSTRCPRYKDITEQFKLYIKSLWVSVFSFIPMGWWELLKELEEGK